MKKGIRESIIMPQVMEFKNNAVGGAYAEKNRLKAIANLQEAKRIDEDKKASGYRWMAHLKTSVLVSPANFKKFKENGYRFI